jgi:small subunit ribosomal protein S14
MARTALVIKTARAQAKATRAHAAGKKPKFSTRLYHRCSHCGRAYGYMGKFDLCRICIRQKANA